MYIYIYMRVLFITCFTPFKNNINKYDILKNRKNTLFVYRLKVSIVVQLGKHVTLIKHIINSCLISCVRFFKTCLFLCV